MKQCSDNHTSSYGKEEKEFLRFGDFLTDSGDNVSAEEIDADSQSYDLSKKHADDAKCIGSCKAIVACYSQEQ